MQSFNSISETEGLVARQNGKGLIILALFPLVGLIVIFSNPRDLIKWYNNFAFGAIFLISFLSLLTVYFWFNILDKRVKLTITKKGIWSRKYGLTTWDSIEAYHFEKRKGKTITYILWIETTTIGNSMKLDITLLDKGFDEIDEAMKKYSKGHELRYSGLNEYEY